MELGIFIFHSCSFGVACHGARQKTMVYAAYQTCWQSTMGIWRNKIDRVTVLNGVYMIE